MIAGIPVATLALPVVISLVSGVGITAVGPGGIFVTIALYALTDLPPAVVVGTASATFVATGILGAASYYRSGELGSASGARAATILSLTGLVGALVGVRLGVFVSLTGVLVFYRTRYGAGSGGYDPAALRGSLAIAVIDSFVGVSGGLLGVGDPVLAVPILVATGVPMRWRSVPPRSSRSSSPPSRRSATSPATPSSGPSRSPSACPNSSSPAGRSPSRSTPSC